MNGLLARSWTAAAAGYDRIFVHQFEPWTASCVHTLRGMLRAEGVASGEAKMYRSIAKGAVWVPCCGPGQELPLLDKLLREFDENDGSGSRRIFATDLAEGMVELARNRGSQIGPHVHAAVGDAMTPPACVDGGFAVILSVFGLQQLPDPALAMSRWVAALSTGGVLVVAFWPHNVEEQGPWATFRHIIAARSCGEQQGSRAPSPAAAWESALEAACEENRGVVEVDTQVSHAIHWESLDFFWDAMTQHGPWEALARRSHVYPCHHQNLCAVVACVCVVSDCDSRQIPCAAVLILLCLFAG